MLKIHQHRAQIQRLDLGNLLEGMFAKVSLHIKQKVRGDGQADVFSYFKDEVCHPCAMLIAQGMPVENEESREEEAPTC